MADTQHAEQKLKRKRVSTVTESAKKRKKTNWSKRRVHVGEELQRWRGLKTESGLKSDEKFAKLLLDRYTEWISQSKVPPEPARLLPVPGPSRVVTSTPAGIVHFPITGPPLSEISSESGLTDVEQPELSGVEELQPGDSSSNGTSKKQAQLKKVSKAGRPLTERAHPQSFVDPFSLSIDVSIDETWCEDTDDPDYEPVVDMNVVLPGDVDSEDDVPYEEIGFGLDTSHNPVDEEEEVEDEPVQGVPKITDQQGCEELAGSTLCISFVKQIIGLAKVKVSDCAVKGCRETPEIKDNFTGSALYLKWICASGHLSHQWCSQPQLNKRLHSGDFLVCATILTSGNNYGKLALWAQMLGLKFPSVDQFNGIQSTYMVPTIDQYWKNHQRLTLGAFTEEPVIVMGDGRNDSPGHCAQYCSYTLMEQTSKKILSLVTVDKRLTDRKSPNMEKLGFEKALQEVLDGNVEVQEVVTDAHLGIGAVMKSRYVDVKHSHDIWHAAKSLGKRLMKVAQKKSNAVLMKWVKDIVNHFWFTCKEASSYEQFVSIWRSVLHHVTNQHSWKVPHGDGEAACLHGALSEEDRNKPWLDPRDDCSVLKDLAAVVLDRRFLGKVSYYLNFRSTADLEGFHQHILMYAAKRFAYTPPVYRVRNELAAIDHNNNVGRPHILNKDGTLRLQRQWNKKSGRWTAHAKQVPKDYSYVKDIITQALVMRIHDREGMRKKRLLAEDDPRRIAPHLAPEKPKPTKEIMEEKVSRFK